jgi:hypothetical protein
MIKTQVVRIKIKYFLKKKWNMSKKNFTFAALFLNKLH